MSIPNKQYYFVNFNRNFIPKNVKNKLLYSNYGESITSEDNIIKNLNAFNKFKKKKKKESKTTHYPKALVKYNYKNKSQDKKTLDISIFPREAFTESSQATESQELNENNKSSDDLLYKNIQDILLPIKAFKLPSKQKYDLSIQPKVFVQYKPRKGEVPRKIVIERTKKKYASINIGNLFYKNGISPEDLYNLLSPNDKIVTSNEIKESKYFNSLKIPLEYFDNTEYESRITEEWLNVDKKPLEIQKREKSDTIPFASIPLPAVAFDYPIWRDCYVIGYNYENNLWNIKWKETSMWYVEENISCEDEDFEENIIDSMLENKLNAINLKVKNDDDEENIVNSTKASVNEKKNIWISR